MNFITTNQQIDSPVNGGIMTTDAIVASVHRTRKAADAAASRNGGTVLYEMQAAGLRRDPKPGDRVPVCHEASGSGYLRPLDE